MQTILCTNCKQPIEINQAIADQISDEEKKNREEAIRFAREEERKNAEKRLREEVSLKEKNYENQLKEDRERIERLMQDLLKANGEMRNLRKKDEEREIENQKRLAELEQKAKEEAIKKVEEEKKYEIMQMKKQLEDTQKSLEEAKRKSEQVSQQLQGEVLELDLEMRLKEHFIYDDILPVPKGVDGADIFQKVKNKMGQVAGSILWETKRTKSWNNAWPAKLRDDKRRADATIAILVSDLLPEGIGNFGLHENVWVVSYKYAIPLAKVLRVGLFEVAIAKSATTHKDERLESLYQYLTNNTFRNRFEAQVESIIEMENDLSTEQRSTVRIWKKRELQIKKLRNNLSGMYGELQGIIGNSLPTIQSLEVVSMLDSEVQEKLLEE